MSAAPPAPLPRPPAKPRPPADRVRNTRRARRAAFASRSRTFAARPAPVKPRPPPPQAPPRVPRRPTMTPATATATATAAPTASKPRSARSSRAGCSAVRRPAAAAEVWAALPVAGDPAGRAVAAEAAHCAGSPHFARCLAAAPPRLTSARGPTIPSWWRPACSARVSARARRAPGTPAIRPVCRERVPPRPVSGPRALGASIARCPRFGTSTARRCRRPARRRAPGRSGSAPRRARGPPHKPCSTGPPDRIL
mmetsp:Transcript_112139/g.362166  ORF Transcript_112139/g.362166 Transcript_112139/m.362166 type:complete len:253 (-) Transcript_112139:836-1594(-)